jgi:hypothetical protein
MVLGERRGAGGPAEPVVERAEPDQEAERRGDQADGGDRVAVDQRLVVVQGAQEDVEAEADRDADQDPERGSVPARPEQLLAQRLGAPAAATAVGGRGLMRAIYRLCCDLSSLPSRPGRGL